MSYLTLENAYMRVPSKPAIVDCARDADGAHVLPAVTHCHERVQASVICVQTTV